MVEMVTQNASDWVPLSQWAPSDWAKIGNSIPHFNFKFEIISPEFQPYYDDYKEVRFNPEPEP